MKKKRNNVIDSTMGKNKKQQRTWIEKPQERERKVYNRKRWRAEQTESSDWRNWYE